MSIEPRTDNRPLCALLSQILVAFTIEFNNEFERRMRDAGYPGAVLSMGVWLSSMRFLAGNDTAVSVRDLAERSMAAPERKMFELGCLERWRLIVLEPDPSDHRAVPRTMHRRAGRELRAGWGSGRGIRPEWIVRPTAKGRQAMEIWPGLFPEIEKRWRTRFGNELLAGLRKTLTAIVEQFDTDLPDALPHDWAGIQPSPEKVAQKAEHLSLPTLLSKLLIVFTLDFNRESRVPLALCANTLRVLEEKPVREGELARLTGSSKETSDIGWQLKPFVVIEKDPSAGRGKLVRLNAKGLAVQADYWRLVGEIEKRWEKRFGKTRIAALRESLQGLFMRRKGDRSLLPEGLLPPEGAVRAGNEAPSLGRREVASAARQRTREMVEQTAEFVRDPAGALPHYPLWDMNRGFGP
jgi:hypothetical protein